ncbi:glycosyl hydrolase family 61-domain-containing protein [Melanogaster broomeanus]|nr:glycosyl hydrolase family 61-domain-containing protein [Melanogaster broomeanus]
MIRILLTFSSVLLLPPPRLSAWICRVSTIGPVKSAIDPSINRGMNATLAANVTNANPGSQFQVHWVGGLMGGSNCTGSCSTHDSTNTEWFKISELGLNDDDTTWYQANITLVYPVAGQPANVGIPSNIDPGEYLLCSELISLQNAMSVGGGSGTGAATSSEECTLRGCYSDTDPGIYDPSEHGNVRRGMDQRRLVRRVN